jgi:hypothetical protein
LSTLWYGPEHQYTDNDYRLALDVPSPSPSTPATDGYEVELIAG